MKRAVCLILAVVMLASLLLAIVPAAYAADFGRHHQKKTEQVCSFVDADQDGICDNHGEHCGSNWTDADHDGICDNRAKNICPRRQMMQGHHSKGYGCGRR